jgi:orotate phosphoribosyltransferase
MSASDRTSNQLRDEVFDLCLENSEGSGPSFDVLRLGADPELHGEVVAALARLIPEGTEVLVGLGWTGGSLVTALSIKTGLPFAVMRDDAAGDRRFPLLEGATVTGKRVAVIEGVVASGLEAMKAVLEVREAGGVVHGVTCVTARPDAGTSRRLADDSLSFSSLFAWPDHP